MVRTDADHSAQPGRLREAILDAARDLTVAQGWNSVRLTDLARRAGVSRQTLYNEFTNRAAIADALAQREIARFVAGVRDQIEAHPSDLRGGLNAAIQHVLQAAADDPFTKAIASSAQGGGAYPAGIHSRPDELLAYLTTRSETVLATATAMLLQAMWTHPIDIADQQLVFRTESIVRLVVSHIVFPTASGEQTANQLTDLAMAILR